MKRAFFLVLIFGILLGLIHESGGGTGIQFLDEGLATLDASLRDYAQGVRAYFVDEDEPGGSSLTDAVGTILGAPPSDDTDNPDTVSEEQQPE